MVLLYLFLGFISGCMLMLNFRIELSCIYFGIFWLGNCLGYFKKMGDFFTSWAQCYETIFARD
jgi:hypothetical protein